MQQPLSPQQDSLVEHAQLGTENGFGADCGASGGREGDEGEASAKTCFSSFLNPNTLLQPHIVSVASPGSQDKWWARRAWAVKGLEQEEMMNTMSYKATSPVCRKCRFC